MQKSSLKELLLILDEISIVRRNFRYSLEKVSRFLFFSEKRRRFAFRTIRFLPPARARDYG